MMGNEVICVHLYGDGSRSARLRAEYIHCDRSGECSAYKNGECFCVTTFFGVRCGIGRVTCVDGCTKQSKTFHRVWREAKAHPNYGKLKYPYHTTVTRIDNDVFLTLPHIWLEEREDGQISCRDPHLSTNRLLVSSDRLTPENIKRICEFRPRAIMGGVITDYQFKTVPMFLHQLRGLFPDKFAEFEKAYPDFEIKAPNWKGRRAKLATCNRDMEYKDGSRGVFRFDGDEIVCDCYDSAFAPFGAKKAKIRLQLSDEIVVEITDNKQVIETTVFV